MGPDERQSDSDTRMEATRDPRWPWWPVGLAMLGLVAVVLVGALLLNRQFLPGVGMAPTPSIVPSPAAVTDPSLTVGAPATALTATPGISGDRVATSPLEREIEDAYFRSVEVYSEALLHLDTGRLSEVFDGEALQLVTQEINDRRATGRALKLVEDDRVLAFGPVTDTSATIVDEYTSRSVIVDVNTAQQLPRTSAPARIRQSYEFRNINGDWKIVDGTREVLDEVGG